MWVRTSRTLGAVAVVGIAATAIAVRLYNLTASGLWADEGGSLQ